MDDPSINIEGVSYPILCGICNKPIAFVGEADANTGQAGCIACGNVADVKEVAGIACEYAIDEAQLSLNRKLRDTARKSKSITFSGKTQNDKTYRFVVDLKP